jgi:hypothetical protein
MAVTTEATVKIGTDALRAAFVAVLPHACRTKKDDDLPLHRVRMILANGKAFVCATQGKTTGLSRLSYMEDSRGDLWEPDDGPIILDLLPENVRLLKQWMAAKAVGDDDDKATGITVDLKAAEAEFELIGSTNAGERHVFQLGEPEALFPDVVKITAAALMQAAGESLPARSLVQDGKLIGLFNAAGVQYQAPLRWRATGTRDTANGFVVECGSAFVGTISTDTGGDEGTRRHTRWTQETISALTDDPTLRAASGQPVGQVLVSV